MVEIARDLDEGNCAYLKLAHGKQVFYVSSRRQLDYNGKVSPDPIGARCPANDVVDPIAK